MRISRIPDAVSLRPLANLGLQAGTPANRSRPRRFEKKSHDASWCRVPNGQNHPQKRRPKKTVNPTTISEKMSPLYRIPVASRVERPLRGDSSRKRRTGVL